MAMLKKSLDELIGEKKAQRTGRGRGAGAKAASGGRGGRGSSKGRQAGGGGGAHVQKSQRSAPYSVNAGRGRGGGGAPKQPVIQRQVVGASAQNRKRVFVTSIPDDWEEQDILYVMETAGDVEKLTIFWDPVGRPTGNALVAYRTEQAATQAVSELNGARLGNNVISVTTARADSRPGAKGGRGSQVAGKGSKGSKGGKQGKQQRTNQVANQKKFGRKGNKGGKGGKGKKGGRKGGARVERKEVSKEELDSQLESFTQS